MTKLYYWDGIIGANDSLERYAPVIEKLQTGDYKGADLDLKKLPDYPLYSVRINDADRLLFTTITGKNNERYLLLLEEIKNHDYQKSRFLKPGVLAHFIENKASALIEQAVAAENFLDDVGEALPGKDKAPIPTEPLPVKYYNNRFIELNITQQNAVYVTLPAKIEGGPGSGKTTSAMACIESRVKQYKEEQAEDKRILYITQSPYLIREVAEAWQQHPSADQSVQVDFETDESLLRKQQAELQGYQVVRSNEFKTWLKEYKKRKKVKGKSTELPEDFLTQENSDALYQEFRIISAYTQEQYFKLGQRESIFNDKAQKEWLWMAYRDYQIALEEKRQFNPAFRLSDQKDQYDFIVADEAQDLSLLQLRQLYELAKAGQMVFCLDPHQSIADTFSKGAFLNTLHPDMQAVLLPGSYRCPKPVIELANQVLSVKFLLTGGTSGKYEISRVSTEYSKETKTAIQWHEPVAEVITPLKNAAGKRSDWVVVTDAKHKQEAKERFTTPLIFTIEEIKGLEYATVIAYQLLESDIFYEVNRLLPEQLPEDMKGKTMYRPKHGESEAEYGPPFNRLFTALTRTTHQLIIVQSHSHKLEKLIAVIQRRLPQIQQPLHISEQAESSRTNWEAEARRLLLNGQEEQARAIYTEKLNQTAQAFIMFKVSVLPAENQQITTHTDMLISVTPQSHSDKKKKAAEKVKPLTAQEVIDQFSETKLETFLKQHDALDSAFKLKVKLKEESQFFIDAILQDPDKVKILENVIKQDQNIQKRFTAKILCSPYLQSGLKAEDSLETLLSRLILSRGQNIIKFLVNKNLSLKRDLVQLGKKMSRKIYSVDRAAIKVVLEKKEVLDSYIDSFAGFQRFMNTLPIEALALFEVILATFYYEADINRVYGHGHKATTLLYFASENGYLTILKALLNHGAHVNWAKEDGITSLLLASYKGHKEIVKVFLEHGTDVNQADPAGATPLFIASQNGHKEIVKMLIGYGASINHEDNNGATSLLMACETGHKEIVETLIDHGARLNQVAKDGTTSLYMASEHGHKEIVKLLIDYGANINQAEENGVTPLSIASSKGHDDIVKMLIGHGADIKQADQSGATPLFASSQNGHKDITKILIDHGANVNVAAKHGTTPLFIASAKEHKDIVVILLKSGADVNLSTRDGVTPLFIASAKGFEVVVKALLQYGATPDLANNHGETPFSIAKKNGHTEVVKLFLPYMLEEAKKKEAEKQQKYKDEQLFEAVKENNLDKVNYWLEQKANPSTIHKFSYPISCLCVGVGFSSFGWYESNNYAHGSNALDLAIRRLDGFTKDTLAIVEALLKHGVDPNSKGEFTHSVLHETLVFYAKSWKGYHSVFTDLISLLCKYGADPNLKDTPIYSSRGPCQSYTPLELAVMNHDIEKATVLLKCRADPNLTNSEKQTPLHLACLYYEKLKDKEYIKIINILVAQGANPLIKDVKGKMPVDYIENLSYKKLLEDYAVSYQEKRLSDYEENSYAFFQDNTKETVTYSASLKPE